MVRLAWRNKLPHSGQLVKEIVRMEGRLGKVENASAASAVAESMEATFTACAVFTFIACAVLSDMS